MSTTKLILLTATVLAGVLYPTSGWYRLDAFNYIHPATDIANDIGTPVYAGVYGTVVRSTWAFNGLGNYIAVRSTRIEPRINPGYLVLYAHLDTRLVSVGAMVTPWTLIGTMGTTGNTTGSHLHWEVRSADGCTLYDPIYGLSPIAANRKPWDWLCESPEINPRINPSPVETTPRPTPPPGAETVRPYSGLKGDTKTWKEE